MGKVSQMTLKARARQSSCTGGRSVAWLWYTAASARKRRSSAAWYCELLPSAAANSRVRVILSVSIRQADARCECYESAGMHLLVCHVGTEIHSC